jgi:hypothetical protein
LCQFFPDTSDQILNSHGTEKAFRPDNNFFIAGRAGASDGTWNLQICFASISGLPSLSGMMFYIQDSRSIPRKSHFAPRLRRKPLLQTGQGVAFEEMKSRSARRLTPGHTHHFP